MIQYIVIILITKQEASQNIMFILRAHTFFFSQGHENLRTGAVNKASFCALKFKTPSPPSAFIWQTSSRTSRGEDASMFSTDAMATESRSACNFILLVAIIPGATHAHVTSKPVLLHEKSNERFGIVRVICKKSVNSTMFSCGMEHRYPLISATIFDIYTVNNKTRRQKPEEGGRKERNQGNY